MIVRFYGKLGHRLGAEIAVTPPVGTDTVAGVRDLLVDMFPAAADDLRRGVRACVDDVIVGESHRLAGSETVEFLPPLSGG